MTTTTTGLWPTVFPRMSSIQPFTYREGMTFQELLYAIKDQVEKVVEWTNSIDGRFLAIEKVLEGLALEKATRVELEDEVEAINAEIVAVAQRLTELINAASRGGVAFNPTTGAENDPVSLVISNVYDFVRTYAEFVADRDESDLTAAERDALPLTAKGMDLYPQPDINYERT